MRASSIFRTSLASRPQQPDNAKEENAFSYQRAKEEGSMGTTGTSASDDEEYEEAHPVNPALDEKKRDEMVIHDGYCLEDAPSTKTAASPSHKLKDSILQLRSKLNEMVPKAEETTVTAKDENQTPAGYQEFQETTNSQTSSSTGNAKSVTEIHSVQKESSFAALGRRIQTHIRRITGKIKSLVKRITATRKQDVQEAVAAAEAAPEGFASLNE